MYSSTSGLGGGGGGGGGGAIVRLGGAREVAVEVELVDDVDGVGLIAGAGLTADATADFPGKGCATGLGLGREVPELWNSNEGSSLGEVKLQRYL